MKYVILIINVCILNGLLLGQTESSATQQDSLIRAFCSDVKPDSVREMMRQLQNFGTRKANNVNHRQIAQWIKNKFVAIGYTNAVLDSFTISSYPSLGWQYNVIATIIGSQKPDSVYILGGHHDSYTSSTYTTAPGADDNASGVAGVIEVARIFKERNYQPQSTIKFMTFAAEEYGLFGSDNYASKARAANERIQMMINYDMISYCPDSSLYWKVMQYCYSNSNSVSDLGDTCRRKFTTLGVQKTYDDVSFSDSYSFFDYAFKVAYFEEVNQSNPHYHTIHDTLGNCNTRFAAEITKISCAMLMSTNGTQTSIDVKDEQLSVKSFDLYPNYPNPFNPSTTIRYTLPESGKVTLKIYNTLGQEVRTLVNTAQTASEHSIQWDGTDNYGVVVSSGIYIYRLQAGNYFKSNKMMLVR